MDEIFPGVILWLMLVFVAIVGGLVSFRSSIHPRMGGRSLVPNGYGSACC